MKKAKSRYPKELYITDADEETSPIWRQAPYHVNENPHDIYVPPKGKRKVALYKLDRVLTFKSDLKIT